MSALLPDQIRVLSSVLEAIDIEIAAKLGIGREEANSFLQTCDDFILKFSNALASKRYVFTLDPTITGGKALQLSHVLSAADGGQPIITLTKSGKFVAMASGKARLKESEQRTKQTGSLELVVHGSYVYVVLNGSVIDEHDVSNRDKEPPVGVVLYRSIREMSTILKDHVEHQIAKEKAVKYWKDRAKRVLLATPETTEKIFQRALILWLKLFVVDKLRIISETRGFGQDATDITVITSHGDYVVEVKWMGTNEKGTKFDGSQITVGMKQVGIYLNNDERLVRGSVVIYDGRPEGSSASDAPDLTCLHSNCEQPYVIFLESDPPSKIAARSA